MNVSLFNNLNNLTFVNFKNNLNNNTRERSKESVNTLLSEDHYLHKKVAVRILKLFQPYENMFLYRMMQESFDYGLDAYNQEIFLVSFKHLLKQLNYSPSIEEEVKVSQSSVEDNATQTFNSPEEVQGVNGKVHKETELDRLARIEIEELQKQEENKQKENQVCASDSKRRQKTQRYRQNRRTIRAIENATKDVELKQQPQKETHLSEYIAPHVARFELGFVTRSVQYVAGIASSHVLRAMKRSGNVYVNDLQEIPRMFCTFNSLTLLSKSLYYFNTGLPKLFVSFFCLVMTLVNIVVTTVDVAYNIAFKIIKMLVFLLFLPVRLTAYCCCTRSQKQARDLFNNTIEGRRLNNKIRNQYKMLGKSETWLSSRKWADDLTGDAYYTSHYDEMCGDNLYNVQRLQKLKADAISAVRYQNYFKALKLEGSATWLVETVHSLQRLITLFVRAIILFIVYRQHRVFAWSIIAYSFLMLWTIKISKYTNIKVTQALLNAGVCSCVIYIYAPTIYNNLCIFVSGLF